jgi:hypothetical protein
VPSYFSSQKWLLKPRTGVAEVAEFSAQTMIFVDRGT